MISALSRTVTSTVTIVALSALLHLAVGVANTAVGFAVICACMVLGGLGTVASNAIGHAYRVVLSFVVNGPFPSRSRTRIDTAIPRFHPVTAQAHVGEWVLQSTLSSRRHDIAPSFEWSTARSRAKDSPSQ